MQETFARVLAKPRRVRGEDDVGYLLQALRNTFISSRRAAARRPAPETLDDGIEPVDPSTGDQARAGRRGAGGVRGDRRPLPSRSATRWSRSTWRASAMAEAAELLGTKEATITSRLFRARAQVARGMESTPQGVQGSRGESDA